MKCTDKLFIINTTLFHQKIRIVNFDFMPTLSSQVVKCKDRKCGYLDKAIIIPCVPMFILSILNSRLCEITISVSQSIVC